MPAAELFRQMARARAFEDTAAALWREGRISGELHLGTGEEAVAAGVVACLREGDAVALDHRATPVLTALGVDPGGAVARRGGPGAPRERRHRGAGAHGRRARRARAERARPPRPDAPRAPRRTGRTEGSARARAAARLDGRGDAPRGRRARRDGAGGRRGGGAAKLEAFTAGDWRAPLVVRSTCGGGYGDGGQHEQALWGLLAGIPGLTVVVPSTPADAYGLMTAALRHDGPVVLLEHKLLSERWLEFMGSGGRRTVSFDVPRDGAEGKVTPGAEVPIGAAAVRRNGRDVTVASVGVGVHRALSAAEALAADGISCEVIDLRTVRPLDRAAVVASVRRAGRLLAVDEDYRDFGLSGELAATVLEASLAPRFARVCTEGTIPYARRLEDVALPSAAAICAAARALVA